MPQQAVDTPRAGAARTVAAAGALLLLAAGAARAAPARFAPLPLTLPEEQIEWVSGLVLADVGGDAQPDLLATFSATNNGGSETGNFARVWINADGGLGGMPILLGPAPGAQAGVVVADFDGDGRSDAIFAGAEISGVAQPTRIYRGQPAGSSPPLVAAGSVGADLESSAIAAADLDADGDPDLAIARAGGSVDFLRNASTPGTFVFQPIQSLATGSLIGNIAFGQFAFDLRPDLAVIRRTFESSELAVYANFGGQVPFQGSEQLEVEHATALAAADLDADGWDDIVVAAGLEVLGPGAFRSGSRVIWRRPAFERDPFRFPAAGHVAVAIADFDQNGQRDILFATPSCRENDPECNAREESSLAIWLRNGTRWEHSGQCLGEYESGRIAIAAGRIGFGPLPDFVALGPPRANSVQPPFVWWRNDASTNQFLCCFAETVQQFGDAEVRAPAPDAVAQVDIEAYAGVRDELMAEAVNGQRLRDRYAQFDTELVALLRADLTLWSDAAAVLSAWSGPIRALLDGDGASATVTQAMVDSVDAFLVRLASEGSPALAQAIAQERALLPPFATFVGLDMDEFRALALPVDRMFVSGFE